MPSLANLDELAIWAWDVKHRCQLAVAATFLVVAPADAVAMGAEIMKVMELCSNGVPWRFFIRKLMRPFDAFGSSLCASSDFSPAVETRADQTTSLSSAADRTSSTVTSLRNFAAGVIWPEFGIYSSSLQ